MNTLRVIIPLLFIFTTSVFAQPEPAKKGPKSYSGGILTDERIQVNNFSFVKKYSPRGDGDYLEVIFDVHNRTDEEIPMRFFVIGFHEKNAIKQPIRYWKGYPKWREKDFEGEDFSIPFYDVIPKLEEDLKKVSKEKKYDDSDFLTLINIVQDNPDKGVDFTLLGVSLTKDPKDQLVLKQNYTVSMQRLKSTVTAKLFSKYRADQKFFNHFGLILVDDKQKKVIYRKFMRFNTTFKIR